MQNMQDRGAQSTGLKNTDQKDKRVGNGWNGKDGCSMAQLGLVCDYEPYKSCPCGKPLHGIVILVFFFQSVSLVKF